MAAQNDKSPRPRDFFSSHPVFTQAEFVAAHTAAGRSPHTSHSLLSARVANGQLLRVRRGVYASVPAGIASESFSPDPYLVATKLRADAVVAFHSALAFHGKAYSVWQRVQYVTKTRPRPFTFRGIEFVGVQAPPAVRGRQDLGGGVLVRPHAGGEVRVASLERSLVDLLHAPDRGGGSEEIWRSLEMVEFFDLDVVVAYALRLRSALTAARVGFFLEQHQEQWMVQAKHLEALQRHAPAQPRYLDRRREPGRLLSRWNLVVPEAILAHQWEEPG